jgi:hypothetical protein
MRDDKPDPPHPPSDEIVVFMVRRETKCAECGEQLSSGNIIRLEKDGALCLSCADLDWLDFLPSGNAAITRRARKYSPAHAVVVQWARARKRYERQGLLVDPAAIARAEEESLADADLRERRRIRNAIRLDEQDRQYIETFAAAVRKQFPNCPAGEEAQIAQHACRKYSGRVGRSAAAKELNAEMIRLAVIAHIRHVHTNYDRLLSEHADRQSARQQVMGNVMQLMARWS